MNRRWYQRALVMVRERLSRIRHFRGHGVHSPYVYDIVREVVMARELLPSVDLSLYSALLSLDQIKERYCRELQNLATHCRYYHFAIDPLDNLYNPLDMVVLSESYPQDQIRSRVEEARKSGTTVVILKPHGTLEREHLCCDILIRHRSATIHRIAYLLIFNNHLPKQHFQL